MKPELWANLHCITVCKINHCGTAVPPNSILYVSLFPGNLVPMSQLSDQEDSNDTETNRVAGEYNETVPQMPPRFIKPGNMNRLVAKPAGNMLRLKCPAEGKQCCS